MSDEAPDRVAPGSRFARLWEEPETSGRGRPARVSRAEVVDAAVTIADEKGLEAVSMRSVAASLGVGAMTLYSHVPGREELVDAMIDRAYVDFDLPATDLDWRPALEAYTRGHWRLLRSHTWLLDINPWRYPLGPHIMTAEEAGYRCLIDSGLRPDQVVETLAVVNNTVIGLARSAAAEAADASRGVDYESYWAGTTDFWVNTFDPARFPSMTRLYTVGAFDTAATPFELRLGNLLDTIGLLIERARAEDAEPIPPFDQCLPTVEEQQGR